MEITDPSEKDPTVVKSNSLIQAGYRLSLAEQRVMLSAIAQIEKNDAPTDQTAYIITASGLANISGMAERRAYQALAEAAHRLYKREVRIEHGPNGKVKGRIIMTRWVQEIEYVEDEGYIKLRFSRSILPYLSLLQKEFTQYKYRYVATMRSTHGIRLYELLTQWQQLGKRELELDELKYIFGITGKYKSIKDLKKYVIEPAVNDINNCSDLSVSWGQRKSGRRVVAIQFQFQSKNRKRLREAVSRADQSQPTNAYDPLAEQVAERRSRTPEAKEASQIALAQLKSMTGMGEDQKDRDELERRGQKRFD